MFEVKCEQYIAENSPDHLRPTGTRRDNSSNPRFNEKLYRLFGIDTQLKLLDLGCSGGGFVRSLLDDGNIAIGIEGSDYSKNNKRAEWRSIPEFLFTCDITKNFRVFDGEFSTEVEFDVITSWEVMEHIKEEDLPAVIENVKHHLKENGMWIISISNTSHIVDGIELHQTRQPKEWWGNLFGKYGLVDNKLLLRYFNRQYVRGRNETEVGYHFILMKSDSVSPVIPRINVSDRILDWWFGSYLHKGLYFLNTGKRL